MSPLHWQIGDVSITRIEETCTAFDRDFICQHSDPAVLESYRDWLYPHFIDDDGKLLLSVHSLLIRSQGKNIIVDTCLGEGFDFGVFPDAGTAFMDNLAKTGVSANDIDTVLCTHLHYDHVGWNTRLEGGKRVPTFPNARYLFGRQEWQYWSAAPDTGFPTTMGECVQPVLDAGLATFVDMDHKITGEVQLQPSPGHTPGHVSVHIASKGETALITGDAVVHPVQWAQPTWANADVDHDVDQATATRTSLREQCHNDNMLVIGTHFAPPSAGHVCKNAGGWWFKAKE